MSFEPNILSRCDLRKFKQICPWVDTDPTPIPDYLEKLLMESEKKHCKQAFVNHKKQL